MTTIDTQGRAVSLETSFLETGMFGDGSDGTVTFDGTSTVLGLVPSSSTYTLNRSIFCSGITINSGVKIVTAGYRILCAGTLANGGTITNAGGAGTNNTGTSGASGGSANVANELGGSGGGGVGATGAAGAGQAGIAGSSVAVGMGGAGATGANGGVGGSGGTNAGGAGGGTGAITSLRPFKSLNHYLMCLSG